MRQYWRLEEGSDCLAGQAEICCHERLSRNIALRIVMSLRATATRAMSFGFPAATSADSLCELTTLGLRGCSRTSISTCRRRLFGPAGILGFCATVTPRLSGSVTLSTWSHRFSIAVELTSCRTKVPSASDRPHVGNGRSIRMLRLLRACVNFSSLRFAGLCPQRSLAAGRSNYQLSYWE